MEIREATATDLPSILSIYNHYVQTSTCTYQTEPYRPDELEAWHAEHDAAHPVTVAVDGEDVVGWGALSWFRQRWGYRFTVEDTVYVRADRHRRGIGRALLEDLIERARNLGHRTIVAGISAEQDASIRLHHAVGFASVGQLRDVGHKFDRWLDLTFLQLIL
jgi:phosphinothricin acetyltransferase